MSLLVVLIALGGLQAGPPHCEIRCPRCKCCVSEVEIVKIKKPCWEVECEPVCIPRVTFPWELKDSGKGCGWFCCPPAKCGKVRMVHVLKPQEYECQECQYKFTPVCCERDACSAGVGPASPDAAPLPPAPPGAARPSREFRLWPLLR
jgi:hypothetical protein